MSVGHLTLLIPAAGHSRRFAADKRPLLLPHVLRKTDRALAGRLDAIVCVLKESDRAQQHTLIPADLQARASIVWLTDAENQGLGASIAAGINACRNSDAVMIALADMPFVEADTLSQLCDLADPTHIMAPVYRNKRGHPVCFGRRFFADLGRLQGDVGAKALFRDYRDSVVLLPVDDAGVLQDVDTQAQWQASLKFSGSD